MAAPPLHNQPRQLKKTVFLKPARPNQAIINLN
jgi:hypothetical protein